MNYKKIYDEIIYRAKIEKNIRINNRKNKSHYYEAHHIVPTCLGGNGKSTQWNHINIVQLTAKEHFLCHLLLCRIYPEEKKLISALWLMINTKNKKQLRYIPNAKTYDNIRNIYKESVSKDKNAMYGINSYRSKCVLQICIDTNIIIRKWDYIQQAILFYKSQNIKLSSSGISRVCNNLRKSCGGYLWKYA